MNITKLGQLNFLNERIQATQKELDNVTTEVNIKTVADYSIPGNLGNVKIPYQLVKTILNSIKQAREEELADLQKQFEDM